MDHNLEESMSIENMDFDHSGVVVNQEDITLEDSSHASDIPMDLDTIEEEPTLLGGESEEVIVSDYIGDQFEFQEYCVQSENASGANITIEANQMGELTTQNEQVQDFQFVDSITKATTSQSGVVTIKAVAQQRATKKVTPAALPRQIAIAPKPMKNTQNVQYAIAPKPVAIMMNKNATNLSKTVPIKNVMPVLKGNSVLTQIGKHLVMVPAGTSGHKIKLSSILPCGSSDSNIQLLRCSPESAQLLTNKGGKPFRAGKQTFIVQGQAGSDATGQPTMITKVLPVSATARARYVMQQKTVPITIGGSKVVLTSSPKQSVKVAPKKQIISIKSSQSPKVVTSQGNVQTKKVVITANPTQNVSGKATGVKMVTQAVKDRTQLQSINVPGKGIQIIKLVTNQQSTAQNPSAKAQTSVAMSAKNFVLTDAKGNIIQMKAEKVVSGQPPPLLVTTTASGTKVPTKGKKLVRIAPISQKTDTPATSQAQRAPQSLLMPRDRESVSLEEFNAMVDRNNLGSFNALTCEETVAEDQDQTPADAQHDTKDVKPTLVSLISEAVEGEENLHEMSNVAEVEVAYDGTLRKRENFSDDENTSSMEHEMSNERQNENILILPPNITNETRQNTRNMYQEEDNSTSMSLQDDSQSMHTVVNVEADVMPYVMSPEMEQSYNNEESTGNADAPGVRPRKPCNCTKSRCLKLYCDCFANGEFCNNCNCNNCHNNLENEDLRQVATRACLERNPNAFRPKIGKAKSGGPEIVRRHTKGCNCKRSGCLKNYCECYEAKIACTMMCKCVGCRNIEETLERRRDAVRLRDKLADPSYRPPLPMGQIKQPCSFMTPEVIEAVAQCMLAAAAERGEDVSADPVEDILLEFSRCMADIISASHQAL